MDMRTAPERADSGHMYSARERYDDCILKAQSYIRAHLAEDITLDSVAGAVYLSPSYLSKLFKKELGFGFRQYLNECRIEKSKALLMETSLRIVDISAAVGFRDQSYFTKVFKRHTGKLPNDYRCPSLSGPTDK